MLACLALAVAPAGEARVTALLPYRDPALTPQARASDLLSRMTLAEKIGQMTQAERGAVRNPADIADYALGSLLSGGGSAPPNNTPAGWADMTDSFQKAALRTRLGIPLLYGTDAVHGNNNLLGAVLYPHNIGLGASRDPALVTRIGRATAEEVAATGANWTFSPCLCVARDVRWGRTYESFGERPELVTEMSGIVNGYQGTPGHPGSILATAKHYLGDGGTTYGSSTDGYLLDQGDTRLTETQLRAVHLPPFQAAIKAGVGSVMVSFSSWNGVKMHAQAYLISEVLEGELGFQGFVVSDWAGVDQISPDYAAAVRTAINAGVDMVMVPNDYPRFIRALTGEVQAGRVPVARINDAVKRVLTQKFRFGLFEHPLADRPFASGVGSAAHRALARQAVRESLVLLKNDHLLPISSSVKRLLVTGSSADALGRQLGGWSVTWQGNSGRTTTGTTILAGLRARAGSGVKIDHLENVSAAQAARYDLGVVVVGEAPYAEGKGDRPDLNLNAGDTHATETVCKAVKCVVIVVSGRPLLLTDQLPQIGALVAAWLPGTEGEGVADMLFGSAGFTGRLPVTWPRTSRQLPVGRPQDAGPPLFPYGFGLSH
ncbi:glycoside hydrolase family 3 protein [Deinococcus sp. UYEF24]